MTTIRRVLFLGCLLFLVPAGALAEPPDSVTTTAEFDRLLSEIASERDTIVALAKVEALDNLSAWVPREHFAESALDAAGRVSDPMVRFSVLQTAEKALHEMNDLRHGAHGMKGPLGEQACLRDWRVVGPFPNASMEGFDTAYGPELGGVGPYEGKLGEIDWRDQPRVDRYCTFTLSSTVKPSRSAVVYVSTQVSSESAARAYLLAGVNGAYRVWVNGEPVAEREEDVGMSADNDAWPLRLKEGDNEILVKIASTSDGGLGFVMRLVDRRLEPLEFISEAKWTRVRTEPVDGELPPSDRGVVARIEDAADEVDGDVGAWTAWMYRRAAWQKASAPWRDLAERLLESPDDLTPRRHALLAQLFDEHWRRLAILEAAHARAPSDPWLTNALAGEYESSIMEPHRLKARSMYEELTREHPAFVIGHVQLADWSDSKGFEEEALELVRKYDAPDRLEIPSYLTRLIRLERSVGSLERARVLEEKAREIMLSGGYTWSKIDDDASAGDYQAALDLLRKYRALNPSSVYAGLKEVELLRALGKPDEAFEEVDLLISMVPGDPDLHEIRASLLVARGQTQEAIASLEEALVHRPQDQSIREYLAFLRPEDNRFWEPWMIADVRGYAEKYAAGSWEYDTVVDQSIVHVAPNGLATEVVQRVDRVLNPDGVDTARKHRVSFQMGDERVEVLRVRVHKPDGSISEDFDTWESGSRRKGSTTYNDTGYVNMRANNVDVGDLIEFRYRVSQIANQNFRGDYFGDLAYLQGTRPIGFERYVALYPKDFPLYFREPKLDHRRVEDELPDGSKPADGYRSTAFVLEEVAHVESDRSQPGYTDVYDYLLVSNKKTYDEVGRWWWNLVEEQLIVDEEIEDRVAELTKGLKTDAEKVAAIHNYVVKNTRYLHVGLGIHGWKPYRTTTCYRNRYGDCKDKASLLKVMLEEAGIDANLVLVRTRRLGHVEDFPASMHVFNHAITYVPQMDLFLDGTAEFNGTRELTPMDQGAQALIVEDGGKARFVELPVDDPEDNLYFTELDVDLTGAKPIVRGKVIATGQNAVYYRTRLEDPERRDEVLEERLSDTFTGAKLIDAQYDNLADLEKDPEIRFTFEGGELLRRNGDDAFIFPIGAPKDLLRAYARQANRNQDLKIRVPFANETKMRYRIPRTRSFERVPDDVEMTGEFGSLKIAYDDSEPTELVVDVRYTIDVQRVPVEKYPAFREFVAEMTAALNETIGVAEKE